MSAGWTNWAMRFWLALLVVFIFSPIALSLIFSFNSARFPTVPLEEFTWRWYETIWADPDVWQAARNSLIVSACTAVLATTLGFCTAYTDYRFNFRFKGPYLALILLPPTIPLLILAFAMLAWMTQLNQTTGLPVSGRLWSIIIAHTVLTAPFAMAIIRLRLNQIDPNLEAAAWNLGASEWGAVRRVILPFCRPAIASALCLTAAVSFDEFAIAWFVGGLDKTIPVLIWEIMTGTIDPQVNAMGSFVFITSMTLVILAQLFVFNRLARGGS